MKNYQTMNVCGIGLCIVETVSPGDTRVVCKLEDAVTAFLDKAETPGYDVFIARDGSLAGSHQQALDDVRVKCATADDALAVLHFINGAKSNVKNDTSSTPNAVDS